jgi:hypothetical protein
MDVHKVLKANRPPSDRPFNEDDPWYGPWVLEARHKGKAFAPIKTVNGIPRAVSSRLSPAKDAKSPPEWICHVVGPGLDSWFMCRVEVNFGRSSLSIRSVAVSIDPPTLVSPSEPTSTSAVEVALPLSGGETTPG